MLRKLLMQLPTGEYFNLAYHLGRASCAKDRNHRELLVPGRPQKLASRAERLTSRLLNSGSRIVTVVTINNAKTPLTSQWLPSSWIEVPTAK